MVQPISSSDSLSSPSAPPWYSCVEPGCRHNGCGPKVRAWGGYGRRYICDQPDCQHQGCAAQKRAQADEQPFGQIYRGPALPQHTVWPNGRPGGPPMRAVEGPPGYWQLVPLG